MAEGSWKIVAASVVLAVGAGVGTAWLMVPGIEPPGGPVVARPDLRIEGENRKLKEQVTAIQREVAELKIEAAARKAFPRGAPAPATAEDPEAARALRDADELRLRAALDRAAGTVAIGKDLREAVVTLLLDASGRMRKIQARAASAPEGDRSAAAEAEDLGRETRRRIEEELTPEQLRAVDQALGAPPQDDGAPVDGAPVDGGKR